MAKAGLLFVGTDDGIVLYSEPGAAGRWLRIGQELRGQPISAVWTWTDDPTVVLATTGSLLLRSIDGGVSWQAGSSVAGGLLASSKAEPATVTCLADDGTLFRSSDAGESWRQVYSLDGASDATRVLIAAPDDPATLYAAIDTRVLASTDGGVSWAVLGSLPDPIISLTVLPNRLGLYAHAHSRLYQYAGATWQLINSTQQLAGPLTLLAGREPTLLAALDSGEVGRSNDGGQTWEPAGAEIGWGTGPQVLIAAPYHMDIAFAGGGPAVALSADRGRTWQRLKGDSNSVRAIAVARLV